MISSLAPHRKALTPSRPHQRRGRCPFLEPLVGRALPSTSTAHLRRLTCVAALLWWAVGLGGRAEADVRFIDTGPTDVRIDFAPYPFADPSRPPAVFETSDSNPFSLPATTVISGDGTLTAKAGVDVTELNPWIVGYDPSLRMTVSTPGFASRMQLGSTGIIQIFDEGGHPPSQSGSEYPWIVSLDGFIAGHLDPGSSLSIFTGVTVNHMIDSGDGTLMGFTFFTDSISTPGDFLLPYSAAARSHGTSSYWDGRGDASSILSVYTDIHLLGTGTVYLDPGYGVTTPLSMPAGVPEPSSLMMVITIGSALAGGSALLGRRDRSPRGDRGQGAKTGT